MHMDPGNLYIARGDADVVVRKRGARLTALSVPASGKYLWHPSVEKMVESAMECLSSDQLVAVQLTGMGNDGSHAMARMKKQGGHTIAESEQSCVVYGLPKELVDLDGATKILHADGIAGQLTEWLM